MTLGLVLKPEENPAPEPAQPRPRPEGKPAREYHKLKREPFSLDLADPQQAAKTLADWIDVDPDKITQALAELDAGTAYEIWRIPKGNGAFCKIASPSDTLKDVQRRILDRLLYRIPCSNAAHGFMPGRSIVTGAKVHLGFASEVFNVDLKDAFPSVKAQRVKQLFVRHVKVPFLHLGRYTGYDEANDLMNLLTRLVTWNGQLPQGAPTSGCLLNIACVTLDKRI